MIHFTKFFVLPLLLTSFDVYPKHSKSAITVEFPSLAHDFRLKEIETYNSLAVINSTSARLVDLSSSMQIEPSVAKNIMLDKDRNILTIILNEKYLTVLGEPITSKDVEYSIKYFVSNPKLTISKILKKAIKGAEQCTNTNCSIPSIKIVNTSTLKIILNKGKGSKIINNMAFMDFILFKNGKPPYIKIGMCRYPYPTGNSQITECKKNYILVKTPKGFVKLVDSSQKNNSTYISMQNPRGFSAPSLSTLAIYFSPKSSIFRESSERTCFKEVFKKHKKIILEKLNLSESKMILSESFGVKLNAEQNLDTPKNKKCSFEKLKKVKVLIEQTIPGWNDFKNLLNNIFSERLEIVPPNYNNFQKSLDDSDIYLGWFSPAFLSAYDLLSIFDCHKGAPCFFDWKDEKLQLLMKNLLHSYTNDVSENVDTILKIEEHVLKNSYAIPVSQMNWWITNRKTYKAVHPAGLTKLKVTDFFL